MHMCIVIKIDKLSLQTEKNKHVVRRDINDDCDGAHLTLFGIEFLIEEESKENERSPCVALLCAGLLSRGMVYELERALRECIGFFCSISVTYHYDNDSGMEK